MDTSAVAKIPEDCAVEQKSSSDFLYLFQEGIETDLTLVSSCQTFLVHSELLSCHSEVFKTILNSIGQDRILNIYDINPNTLEQLLIYMYSGEITSHLIPDLFSLYDTAEIYSIEALRSKCTKAIKDNFKKEEACDVLLAADDRQAGDLKEFVVSFIAEDDEILFSERWFEFCEKFPDLTNEVIIAYEKKHK